MEKKTECEIVQDLLLGYVDGTLNGESKKLVEKHLSECESCIERLKQIREDIDENKNNQKKEIDYLKKIRIKSKIKSMLLAIGILILIALIVFLNDFIKINSIMNKAEKSLQSNNFYKQTTQIMFDNHTSIKKEYYKDGKYKSIWEIYSDNGIETSIIEYADVNSDERIYIYETDKKAIIEKGDISKIKNDVNAIKTAPFVSDRNNLYNKLGTTFIYSIDTDTYDYGQEYYVLKNKQEENRWEIWIDTKTGLPIKQINRGGAKSFFTGTNVVREIIDNIQEYKYEFDIVTDGDVKAPDLSNYTVENKVLNMDDMLK